MSQQNEQGMLSAAMLALNQGQITHLRMPSMLGASRSLVRQCSRIPAAHLCMQVVERCNDGVGKAIIDDAADILHISPP